MLPVFWCAGAGVQRLMDMKEEESGFLKVTEFPQSSWPRPILYGLKFSGWVGQMEEDLVRSTE